MSQWKPSGAAHAVQSVVAGTHDAREVIDDPGIHVVGAGSREICCYLSVRLGKCDQLRPGVRSPAPTTVSWAASTENALASASFRGAELGEEHFDVGIAVWIARCKAPLQVAEKPLSQGTLEIVQPVENPLQEPKFIIGELWGPRQRR